MTKTGKSPVKRVRFNYYAPQAGLVCVAGAFNGWDPRRDPMKKGPRGWTLTKTLRSGTYEYRFVVDGIWRDDPSCPTRRPNPFGGENCVLEV